MGLTGAAGLPLAVSVGVSPRQGLSAWAEQAARLEQEGVDRLWLIDSQLAMKDVYAGLLLAAQRTRRLRLGPGVTNPLTRHPTVTATALAALAEVSAGRALLGLGAGDSAVYGVGWRPARVAVVEEAARFLRAVLAGGEGSWQGRVYRLPQPGPRVPLYLAASQARMCRLAGMVADGVILMGPADAEYVRRQVGWVEAGAVAAGRERRELDVTLVVTLSARQQLPEALDDVRSWASTEARLIADFAELPASLERFRPELERARAAYDFTQHLSTRAGHQSAVSDQLTRALAVAGSAEECSYRLAELLAAGIDGCIFPLPGGGRLARLRTIRDRVIPLAASGR